MGALGVDCDDALAPVAGGGLAVSMVLFCCSPSCLGNSCGGPSGPISLAWFPEAPCCCDAGEDPRSIGKRKTIQSRFIN